MSDKLRRAARHTFVDLIKGWAAGIFWFTMIAGGSYLAGFGEEYPMISTMLVTGLCMLPVMALAAFRTHLRSENGYR